MGMDKLEVPKTHWKEGEKSTITLKGEKIPYILWSEFEWLSFVENRPALAGIDVAEASRIADHINGLINRYLDSIEMKPKNRYQTRKAIAEGITPILEKHSIPPVLSVVPKAPNVNPKDEASFELGGGTYGIGTIYRSLALFLSSKYLSRLRRCTYCKDWFVAPDDREYKYCPKTDHKKRHWNEERARTGYHRQDMAERRDPDSTKYDARYKP